MSKAAAKLRRVSVQLPFGIGGAEWEADESQIRAAWSLYVELVTRISTQALAPDQGLLREALSSLHALFGVTRQILRDAGPSVGSSPKSVGGISIAALNRGIRPFLSKWHAELEAWELRRESRVSPFEHERAWSQLEPLRADLAALTSELRQYASALAEIAGVADMTHD